MNSSVLLLILAAVGAVLVPAACVIVGMLLARRKHRAWIALAAAGVVLLGVEIFTLFRLFF